MKISILILTYNRSDILRELLMSLGDISYSPLEIIVTDNHSTDNTELMMRNEFPNIAYYIMDANIGVGARNVGMSNATGDIVITIDDDVIGIGDSEIKTIIRIFNAKPDIGAVCFRIVDYYTGKICNWCHHYKTEEFCNREFITDEITEGAVALRRATLDKSGLYPEYFFISHEGADLLFRMLEAGYKTVFSPEICVKHRTAPGGRKNWRRYYYDTRNQIWLAARNFPVLWGLKYLCRGLAAMFFYSIRDGFLLYWFKGLWDGFGRLPKVLKDRKSLSKKSLNILKKISKNRPGFGYMIKKRVFKKEVKL